MSKLWVLRSAPAPKYGLRKGSRADKATFELASLCWRAGLVDDYYRGRRSPSDRTLIWAIDGIEHEYTRDELDWILRERMKRHGIRELRYGPSWCGFRSVTIVYTDGSTATERYNGVRVVIDESELTESESAA